jgi:hypothetical protein
MNILTQFAGLLAKAATAKQEDFVGNQAEYATEQCELLARNPGIVCQDNGICSYCQYKKSHSAIRKDPFDLAAEHMKSLRALAKRVGP